MKLSTMRLPTGEFVIVVAEAKYNPTLHDAIKTLKDGTGAAAVLVTDEVVEVEDAIIDEDARRADKRTPYQQAEDLAGQDSGTGGDNFPTTTLYFPNLHFESIGTLTDDSVSFTATAHPSPQPGDIYIAENGDFRTVDKTTTLSPEDYAVTRAIMEGHEFSPAGLVIGDHRLLHGTPPAEEQGTPGGDPEPDGDLADDIVEPMGTAEPAPILPGDEVVVNGTSWLGTTVKDFRGVVQRIREQDKRTLERSTERDGYTISVKENVNGRRQMYFRPADVQHAPVEAPEPVVPQIGDTVRIKVDRSLWGTEGLLDMLGTVVDGENHGSGTVPNVHASLWVKIPDGHLVAIRKTDLEVVV